MVTQNQLYAHQQNTLTDIDEDDKVDLLSFMNGAIPTTATTSTDDVRSTRKERTPRIRSFRLLKGNGGRGPLDNPDFAPPPLLPPEDELLKPTYSLNAQQEADYENLPRYDKIRHSGTIMTRFSTYALLTKKWSQNFWILYANCLYFFRSKDDFEEWLLNPYLSKSDRGNLVKRYLKFDSANAKYFDMDKTRMKYYRKGGMMYHFKLVLHYVRGNSTSLHLVGAFSSMNENDVTGLRTIIDIMLKKNPNYTVFQHSLNSDTQSIYSSDYALTDGRRSAVSAEF